MRDADVMLYDAACRVLEATRSLREAAEERRGDAPIAPTVGCLQEALRELEPAVAALGRRMPAGDPAARHRLRSALDDLVATLRFADRAAEAARAAAAEAGRPRAASGLAGRRCPAPPARPPLRRRR